MKKVFAVYGKLHLSKRLHFGREWQSKYQDIGSENQLNLCFQCTILNLALIFAVGIVHETLPIAM